MATVTFRFYAELNDFLPPDRRQRDWTLDFAPPAPVGHLIEACGVPHTEVELILRGDESLGLDAPVGSGERIAVYPMLESLDVRPLLRVRERPLRRPRFLADAHLGALARALRMLGFDTLWFNDLGDPELARLAVEEERILLTRDRQLLMRRTLTHGCYLRAHTPTDQLVYLVERLQLCSEIAPFTRCMECNGVLIPAEPAAVRDLVAPAISGRHEAFWRCESCRRVYWQGSHWASMRRRLATICPRHEAAANVGDEGAAKDLGPSSRS